VSLLPLSLILPTRNRAEQLRRCLQKLPGEALRALGGQLVAVDNGSSDATPQVLREFAARAPFQVDVVEESTPGVSRARNAGLARAGGELIVFMDDDCYFGERYFELALAAFADDGIDYAGGRILPFDPSDARLAYNFDEQRRSFPPRSFVAAGAVQGSNMIVRRRVLDRIGGWDTTLGDGTPFRCADIDLIARASLAGFTGAHLPQLVVYHHHGRKPGAPARRHEKANDYARGAYYAKQLRQAPLAYAMGWMRESLLRPWRVRRLPREIRGALDYLRRG
jgi:GT2 family glycosyltransferase